MHCVYNVFVYKVIKVRFLMYYVYNIFVYKVLRIRFWIQCLQCICLQGAKGYNVYIVF